MNAIHIARAAGFVIVALGSAAFGISAVLTRPPRWIALACYILAPSGIAWAVIAFVLLFHSAHLSRHAVWTLTCTKLALGGVGAGLLLLLLISGELKKAFRRDQPQQT